MIGYSQARERAHWLLDLEVGGRVYFLSDRGATVTDDRGATREYIEGLGEIDASRIQEGGSDLEVRATITIDEDWAELESWGHSLERCRCVLRRWWEGTTLEKADVYLVGLSEDPSYGRRGEPLELVLARRLSSTSELVLTSQQIVSDRTWPVRGGGYAVGRPAYQCGYQVVFGCPGNDPGAATPRAAVPAYAVEHDGGLGSRWMLGRGKLTATSVRFYDYTSNGAETLTPAQTDDAYGCEVTIVEPAGAALGGEDHEYWWGVDDANGGGIVSPYDVGQPLRGAGDVLWWVLTHHTTTDADGPRMRAYAPVLNRYQVDTYINDPETTWAEWVESLLRWVPCQPRQSAEGLYYLPLRWDYTLADCVAYLSADRQEIQRSTQVQRLRQEVANEITVRFRPSRESGKWWGSFTLTADTGRLTGAMSGADPTIVGSHLAARSQAVYGVRPMTIDLAQTWDDSTARLVAWDMLHRYSWPKRTVTYLADREYEAIDPGVAVAITDSELHLTDAVAYVVDVRAVESGVELDLVLLDHPVAKTETTS